MSLSQTSLFFGDADWPINIYSIRVIKTCTNYEEIILAMTLFDNVISGNIYVEHKEESSSFKDYTRILKHLLFDKNRNTFSQFIYWSWRLFIRNKTEIEIDISDLNKYIGHFGFSKLLFCDFKTYEYSDGDDRVYLMTTDNTNLIKEEILKIFSNVTYIFIRGTENRFSRNYWSFSLLQLLTLINETGINRVKILANTHTSPSWLSCLWNKSSSSLIHAYKCKGFEIKYNNPSVYINKI